MKQKHINYIALAMMAIGAASMLTDFLPSKYAGLIAMLACLAKFEAKFSGESQDFQDGEQLGQELKTDIQVMDAKKPGK